MALWGAAVCRGPFFLHHCRQALIWLLPLAFWRFDRRAARIEWPMQEFPCLRVTSSDAVVPLMEKIAHAGHGTEQRDDTMAAGLRGFGLGLSMAAVSDVEIPSSMEQTTLLRLSPPPPLSILAGAPATLRPDGRV